MTTAEISSPKRDPLIGSRISSALYHVISAQKLLTELPDSNAREDLAIAVKALRTIETSIHLLRFLSSPGDSTMMMMTTLNRIYGIARAALRKVR